MRIVKYSHARENFREILDQVVDDCFPTCIISATHQVVLISKSDYDSLIESAYCNKHLNNPRRPVV